MNLLNAKGIIFDSLKDIGFKTSNKRIFIQDCGFYLIVVEVQPLRNEGFLLNVGVKFLWSSYYDISYDYSMGDSRIPARGNPLGAILFESHTADIEIKHLLTDTHEKITEYQKLIFFDVFKDKIENRDDFVKRVNRDFEKSDISLAIIKMFSGESLEARTILNVAANNDEVGERLLKYCGNIELFRDNLINIINNCRQAMSSKLKLSLPPVSDLWAI